MGSDLVVNKRFMFSVLGAFLKNVFCGSLWNLILNPYEIQLNTDLSAPRTFQNPSFFLRKVLDLTTTGSQSSESVHLQ